MTMMRKVRQATPSTSPLTITTVKAAERPKKREVLEAKNLIKEIILRC